MNPDTCGLAIRFEYGYTWTWKFLNPEIKICGFKNTRIRLNGNYRYDRIAMSIKFDNVTRAKMARNFGQKCAAGLFISQTWCMFFLIFTLPSPSSWSLELLSSVTMQTNIDMRRFRLKADDLMGKGRRKRRPQLLANREARI